MNNYSQRAKRDVEHFDNIASQYCKKDLYPPAVVARKLRLTQTFKLLPFDTFKNLNILEVGCGAGFSAQYLQGFYQNYTGIDYSSELIDIAEKTNKRSCASFQSADLFNYTSSDQFDVIFMIGVLHHIPDIGGALEVCKRLIKPGGYLLLNEPQPDNALIHVLRKLRAHVDSSYSAEQEELRRDFLYEALDNAGYRNIRDRPQGFLSTPIAEVILRPEFLMVPLSKMICSVDKAIEARCPKMMRKLSWNIIFIAQV